MVKVMHIFRHKKAVGDWIRGPDGKWTKEKPDLSDILEALEVTRPCLPTEDPMWTPEEHESFVQELKKYPGEAYGWIAETIGAKSAAQVANYGVKCWESDEYQHVVARRQQSKANRPRRRVRKWLRAALDWCVRVFSLRCLRSRYDPKTQATEAFFDTEALRPCPVAGPVARGSIFIPQEEESDEDDSDLRLAHQAAEQIEWYKSGSSRSASKTQVIKKKTGPWTEEEHDRYCEALEMYRYGSWKVIADFVGTRTERQVMSHAQSIRAKRKRAEKREERQKNRPTTLAKTTAEGGRVDPSPAKVRKLTPATDTLSQEARHSLELPSEETAKESTTRPLSTTKRGGNYIALDSPLCSPPLDIMIGSFYSDEELFELIHTPSPLMGETFTL